MKNIFVNTNMLRNSSVLLVLLLALLQVGCSRHTLGLRYPATNATDAQVSLDLVQIPQDVAPFAQQVGKGTTLFSREEQQRATALFTKKLYEPWQKTKPSFTAEQAFWPVYSMSAKSGYAENMRPYPQKDWDAIVENNNIQNYPARVTAGITVQHVELRGMPTQKPYFKSQEIAGEGYPFDYFLHSVLWLGTPVLITHVSTDGLWVFVETARVSGWAKAAHIAAVDAQFRGRWQNAPLQVLTVDEAILSSVRTDKVTARSASVATSRVGMLLPQAPFGGDNAKKTGIKAVYYPVRNLDGTAQLDKAVMQIGHLEQRGQGQPRQPIEQERDLPLVSSWPIEPTPNNMALLIATMMGQPYGWAGYLDNRDCSALMVDLFASVGVWLPRNSGQQANAGQGISIVNLSAEEKEQRILAQAKPFTSLLWLKGHIGLYLGTHNATPVFLHDVWGVKLANDGQESRAVIGKVVITSLSPGKEHAYIATPASILDRIERIVLLPKK